MGPGRSLLRQWPPRHICCRPAVRARDGVRATTAADPIGRRRRRSRYGLRRRPEAREALQRDTGLVQDLLDGLLVVLGERLVEQDVLLEEAVDATLDDLRQGGLGLALLARGLLGDAALVLDGLGRDLLAGEVLRRERGDVLRDVLGDLGVLPCPARPGRRPAAAGPGWCGAGTRRRSRRRTARSGPGRSSRRGWRWPRRRTPGRSCRPRSRRRAAPRGRPGRSRRRARRWRRRRRWNLSPLATKSVSHFSSTRTPEVLSSAMRATTAPFSAVRPSRLATPFWPLTRRISTALSTSPSASSSAFLQSIMPAPVSSRSFLTSAAV